MTRSCMRPVLRHALLAAALAPIALAPCATAGPPPDAGEIPIAEIIDKLKTLETKVNSLSVKATYRGVMSYQSHPDILAPLTNVETLTVERSGRARLEVDGQTFRVVDGKAVVRPAKRFASFDGTLLREFGGAAPLSSGLISKDPGGMRGWTLNPFEATTLFHSTPVSRILAERGGRVVGRAVHDGHDVLVVETEPITGETGRGWNDRFLIDPTLNHAVVRRGQLIRFPAHEGWDEFDIIDSHDHREVEPGVWLPARVEVRTTSPTEADARAGREPKLRWNWDIRAEDWAVNPKVEDSLFALEFPPGTTVDNQVTGRVETIPLPEGPPRPHPSEVLVGKPAPEFPAGATWLNGAPLTWDALRGKVVILDFFAEWCGPCREDYPQLSRLHEERGANGLTVIGIHPPGSKPEAIRKVIDEFHLNYPVCIDPAAADATKAWGEFYRRFEIDLIPHAVAVDGRGVVVATGRLRDVLPKASALAKPR